MTPPAGKEMAPVAIHRWFAEGEGWAYHPELEKRLPHLVAAVDGLLKRTRSDPGLIAVNGHRLLTALEDDPACADPRARERKPFILRVAWLPPNAIAEEVEQQAGRLKELPAPAAPGQTPQLYLVVSVGPPEAPARSVVMPYKVNAGPDPAKEPGQEDGRRLWRWAVVLGAAAAVVFLVVYGLKNGLVDHPTDQGKRERGKGSPEKATGRIADPETIIGQADWDKLDHPYIEFRNRLKVNPLPEGEALRGQYESWRETLRGKTWKARNIPLPIGILREVERYRRPSPPLEEAAARMEKLNASWAAAGQSRGRQPGKPTAFDTFRSFFGHLTRPRLPAKGTVDSPEFWFLWRLPADPVAENQVIENEKDLCVHLADLLRHLKESDGQSVDRSALTTRPLDLLATIERELDYEAWRKRNDRPYAGGDPDKQLETREEFEKKFGKAPAGP